MGFLARASIYQSGEPLRHGGVPASRFLGTSASAPRSLTPASDRASKTCLRGGIWGPQARGALRVRMDGLARRGVSFGYSPLQDGL
jgi:hypothetical protein